METGSDSTLPTRENFIHRTVGKCPTVEVQFGGVKLQCLLNFGSEVTTVTEIFFMTFMQPKGRKLINIDGWLRLRAANGLYISPMLAMLSWIWRSAENLYLEWVY